MFVSEEKQIDRYRPWSVFQAIPCRLVLDRDAACCVPDTDCEECRHYAAGSAVVTARLYRHVTDPNTFKSWLDYVDTYLPCGWRVMKRAITSARWWSIHPERGNDKSIEAGNIYENRQFFAGWRVAWTLQENILSEYPQFHLWCDESMQFTLQGCFFFSSNEHQAASRKRM